MTKKTKKAKAVETDLVAENREVMTKELIALCDEARPYAKADAQMIINRWELGSLVQKAVGNDRRYGEGALRCMAIELYGSPRQEALLQRCRVLSSTYEKKDLQALIKRQGDTTRLTWTHVDALCQLSGSKKAAARREALENRIIDDGMTVDEVRAEIIKFQGGKRSKGGRASAAAPRTPMAALQRFNNDARRIVDQSEIWEGYMLEPLARFEDEDRNADLLEQLQSAFTSADELDDMLEEYKTKLQEEIEKTSAVVSSSGEGAVEDEDEDDGEEAEDAEEEAADDDDDDAEEAAPQKQKASKKSGKKGRSKKRRKAVAAE
jgi:hypothetical protein